MPEIVSGFSRTRTPVPERMKEAIANPYAVIRELNKRSFYHFLQYFWPIVSAHTFQPNWHIDYLCRELEKVAYAVGNKKPKENDVIINISPGTTKTITCSIMFPVWCWTQWPWMRFICASYSGALALESADYCRELLRSPEFHTIYPDIVIRDDKDTKSLFKIVQKINVEKLGRSREISGGYRFSTSVGGTLMGFHGDILIVDDPINPTQAASDVELGIANRWMEQTLPTRKTDKAISTLILIMQRLSQLDPTGHLLSKDKENIKHICIPGEIRQYKEYLKPPELEKYYVDDLMDVNRMPWKVLKDLEADLGQYGYAGQIGQNPVPPGGGMFKVERFSVITEMPSRAHIVKTVRYWDKAGTQDGGAYTAGLKMSLLQSGKWVVEDIKRGRWGTDERENIIRYTAEADGKHVIVWIEQEPGPVYEEELIQMADGTQKKLKNIEVGDAVINCNGEYTKVLQTHNQGKLDCYKITTDSGREIHISEDHPVLTPNGWVVAKYLNVDDVLALKTGINNIPRYKSIPEEFRLVGYFIGDGCVTFTRGSKIGCQSNIVSSDPTEGLDIIHCAEKMGFHVLVGGSKGWTYQISNGIKDWLRLRRIAGKGTLDKEVPKWVMQSNKEGVANFLGAYFACDGGASYSIDHPSIEYYSTSLKLLKQTQSLLLRFGVYTMLRKRNYSDEFQKNRHFCYRLVMRRKDGSMGKFAKHIPVYGVKNERINKYKEIVFDQPYLPDPIVKIEKIGKLPCRCLTVQEGDSFLVNDIVVHNSSGKEGAESTIRNLAGFVAFAERPTGDKAFRADPVSVQVNNGNVLLLAGIWHRAFLDELRFFPFSSFKDQTDAFSGAFSKLTQKKFAQRIT